MKTAHTITTLYWIGDVVFKRVSDEREPGIVTSVTITPGNVPLFGVTFDDKYKDLYEFELTSEFIPVPLTNETADQTI